jgi:hypothetical protein
MGTVCKGCGSPIQWGFCDGRWVPLEPIASHGALDRRYVDEDGELRADHRDVCPVNGSSGVTVTRLARRVRADEANAQIEEPA